MTDVEQASAHGAAAVQLMRALARAREQPGHRGEITEQHLSEIQEGLCIYVLARFAGKIERTEATAIAKQVAVVHFAVRYASFSAVDLHQQDDPVHELLMKAADDEALDHLIRRRPGGSEHVPSRESDDAVLVRIIFGSTEVKEVMTALRGLLCECAAVEHRVVCCYLDLAQERGRRLKLREVAIAAGVPKERVSDIMLGFVNRLGHLP